ncbi:unnamed protein product [Ostreobium quekettii]|uniref:MaoC-like domain-containing protein n=1 Tax=Ostreobium quekettii TaxID=121088 RepID=A0A8S1J1Z3_9CHLO|nr:unnamed protein product [Ostreobium quekettii]|eukprot:evm.model.scf_1079EXC.5 EVM.evm.TU.scf_1079EXC.5   scf_1079EXC:24250-25112(-)
MASAGEAKVCHPLGDLKVGDRGTWTREALPKYTEMYAEVTGDRNPLHFDEEFASRTKFGSLVCHGGIAAGTLNALVAEVLPGPGSVFLRQELDYTAPTHPGDTLTAVGVVTSIHETKPVVNMDVEVKSQEDTTVLKGKVVVYKMIPKDTTAS